MCSDDVDYWDGMPDITEDVMAYSKIFISRFVNDTRTLDYSEESLINEINHEIDNYSDWDLTTVEARLYWAQVLAYFSATLCILFDGRCVGEFFKNNPGPSYYTFRVKLKGKYYNIEDVVGRACNGQFKFSIWYGNFKTDLKNK